MTDVHIYEHKHRNGQTTQLEWISPTVFRAHSSFGPQVRRRRRSWRSRFVDVGILGLFVLVCALSLAAIVAFAVSMFILIHALGEFARHLVSGGYLS